MPICLLKEGMRYTETKSWVGLLTRSWHNPQLFVVYYIQTFIKRL